MAKGCKILDNSLFYVISRRQTTESYQNNSERCWWTRNWRICLLI